MRLPALVASFALLATAVQAQERREVGPHVHGAGTLNIAIEGNKVSMDFNVPANDILGFEHQPTTLDQKQAFDRATEVLGKPLDLFALPTAAGCTVASAKVVFDAGEAQDAKVETKPAMEGHVHADFDIEYVLTCQSPDKLDALTFPYFNQFAGAQKLTVTVVAEKGQSQFEVKRDAPKHALK